MVETSRSWPVAPATDDDDLLLLIAEAAYLRAERRGFAPGYADEDWIAAEAEIRDLFARSEIP